ncbi:ABC transporter transmembrane domain-containing protein [Paucibacter sp. KCTC 42545]|uniref:ABC transporter transmembrane domain-containing protein n=1 Tax=Paucibacter sp. KCTC 42545 TaxID=1768242 RepID=UPI001E63A25F|nr:ABC transporter transmembrane domain-containing protein [Paucibacter sp. KCTC 42545]
MGLKRSLLQIFAVAVVLELFAVLAPLFNQMVVDDVLTSGDRDLLSVLVIGFGLLLVVQTAVGLARSWMVMVLGQTLSLQWMGNVFAHLVRLPVDFLEKRHLGDITSRFGAVSAIQKTLTTAAIEAVLDGLMAVAALVMMLIYAPTLCAVTVTAVAAYGLLRWVAYRPFRDAAAERLVVAAKENTHFLETLRAITPLKLFGREEERRARWQNLIVDVQNRDVRTAKMSIGFTTANTFIFGLENLLVLWLGAKLIMTGQPVQAGQTLVNLIPETAQQGASTLEAQLYAPSRTAGFVKPGQVVWLRYAAYPYQKFGMAEGEVQTISQTPIAAQDLPVGQGQALLTAAQANEPLYRVSVKLKKQAITTYGNTQLLKAGMALDADVMQYRRTVWEWVFEPIFATSSFFKELGGRRSFAHSE